MSEPSQVQTIKADQFESLLKQHDLIFVDFWASWCAPCRQFASVYERVAALFPKILFGKINIEEEVEFANVFEIRSIPHLMVFKQGIAIYSESGSMPESTLKELVEQAISADVSGLLDEIEEEKQR